MFVLGVIPARGGSKGLPGKNLKPLQGLPLIGWTIRSSRGAVALTRTIVSTEDASISSEAKRLGAEVPFSRPQALAQDISSIVDVLQHAVHWHEGAGGPKPDLVVLLQPTSPLRSPADIDETVRLLLDSGADSAETVAEDRTHPLHRYTLEDGRLKPLFPEAERHSRRQDAPAVYKPTGSVYAMRYKTLMEQGQVRGRDHRGLVRPFERSVDVDTLWDFRLAEAILAEAAAPA